MEDIFAVYSEYGAVAIICGLFAYMITNLIKSQREQTEDLEHIKQSIHKMESVNDNIQSVVIKLIDRWNSVEEKQERRHEKSVEIQNNVTDTLNFIKGRLNNKGG